jgi:hypothetical protein
MQFQSDLKECVEFRGIFHLQFLSVCKGLGFRVFLGFRVLCQGLFFLTEYSFLMHKNLAGISQCIGRASYEA